MTNNDFANAAARILDTCGRVLTKKGEEYSNDTDRLCAFKRAAELQNSTPASALFGMLAKHLVSLSDMCTSQDQKYSLERWEEKICDSINYLVLLYAVVVERCHYPEVNVLESH